MQEWLFRFKHGLSVGILAGLVLLHGALTLRLFGATPSEMLQGLTDDQPLLTGRHALHYAQGVHRAQQWSGQGAIVGYDAEYFAGYPLTPWFDGGSHPAALFAWCGGSSPAVYKLGVALSWWVLPLLLWLSAAALGWTWTLRNAALGWTLLLCWSPWGRERLWAGDLAMLLSTGCLALTVTLLSRFHDRPSWGSGLGYAAAAALSLFLLPFMAVCLLPAVIVFYFLTGPYRPWSWHLALALATLAALAVNALWLHALVETWWLLGERTLPVTTGLPPRSWPWLATTWTWPLATRLLLLVLLAGGALGLVQARRGKPGSLLALLAAMTAAWALALLGPFWEGCHALEPDRFLATTVILAILPTGQGMIALIGWLRRTVSPRRLALAVLAIVSFLEGSLQLHRHVREWVKDCGRLPALPRGFTAEQRGCLERLRLQTTGTARILWEDTPATADWSPLLAQHTHRNYVGGLGADGVIEHTQLRWAQGLLARKPLHAWSAAEVEAFCHRYNIGWIVSHTPKGTQFWRQQPLAREVEQMPGGGHLFALDRPRTWFLEGGGRIVHCDGQRLTLEDLEPTAGRIVLSFHYHDRMRSSDQRVRLEPAAGDSGVPLLQLRLDAPAARVTITW